MAWRFTENKKIIKKNPMLVDWGVETWSLLLLFSLRIWASVGLKLCNTLAAVKSVFPVKAV